MGAKKWLNLLHRHGLVYFVRVILSTLWGIGRKVEPVKDEILKESATALAAKIRTKKITSLQVMESFIARIKHVNPILNCVVDNRFDNAIKEAKEVDNLISSGQYTEEELERDKPFLGIPVSTKDCIAVKDLLHTAGLHVRRNIRAEEDSEAMALMKKAGAIPFALTNVSECCMWWESYNPVHGRSNNPYDTNRIVGGSSGGEACLLAASGSPIGIGSDIGGSIRMPAFFNGIFGHKPSKFIVSNEGQWPMPHTEQSAFLSIGPMSRYACDLKSMLKVIAGKNTNKLNLDQPVDMSNMKIFYQFDDGGGHLISPVDNDIKEVMNKVVKHFETICKQKPQQKQIKQLKSSASIWLANMKSPINDNGFDSQLLNLKGKINPYWELCKWFTGQSNHTFVAIMTALTEKTGVKYGSSKHSYFVQQKQTLLTNFENMLSNDGVFLYPTHPTVAPFHYEPIARALNFSYTGIINILGLPATAVPLGIGKEGLPIGIQVVANANQDRLCLAVACELERVFGGYREPGMFS